MEKIVGNKKILFLAIISFFTVQADGLVRVVDRKGIPLKQVIVGVPFKVEFILENTTQAAAPNIKGLDALVVDGKETRMHVINGKTTVIYAYHAHVMQPGSYTLGPVNEPGFHAPAFTFSAQAAPPQNVQAKRSLGQSVFARVTTDKARAVVGEKIHCSLRFYYQDDALSLANVSEPSFSGMTFKARIGPQAGTEVINKISYSYIEWEWDAIPTKAGKILVPAYSLDFTIPSDQGNSGDLFSMFFRQRPIAKRIYSNSVELMIDSLPGNGEKVAAVGLFKSFRAKVKPKKAQQGEGILLTLEIMGTGDLDSFDTLPLENIPDGIKWYESKNYTEETSQGMKKSFEYVLQGLQPGEWHIPAQKFSFYDTKQRSYKSLESNPLTLTITPAPSATRAEQPQKNDTPAIATSIVPDDIRPINNDGPVHRSAPRHVPWWIFSTICLIPLFWYGFPAMPSLIGMNRRSKKKNFVQARTLLRQAEHNKAYGDVHAIFQDILVCSALGTQSSSGDLGETAMHTLKLDEKRLAEWHVFFERAQLYAFSGQMTRDDAKEEFFKQAHEWITFFEGKL